MEGGAGGRWDRLPRTPLVQLLPALLANRCLARIPRLFGGTAPSSSAGSAGPMADPILATSPRCDASSGPCAVSCCPVCQQARVTGLRKGKDCCQFAYFGDTVGPCLSCRSFRQHLPCVRSVFCLRSGCSCLLGVWRRARVIKVVPVLYRLNL